MTSPTITHDWETYSEAGFVWTPELNKWKALPNAKQGKKGLSVVGAAIYAQHPSTEVLMYRYRLPGAASTSHWRPGLPLPLDLFAAIAAGAVLDAWNSAFERWIWDEVCRPKYGFPEWPFAQQRCDMAAARAHALPGSLGEAGDVIRANVRKDKRGDALIKKFCSPRDPTKGDPRRRILLCWGTEYEAICAYAALGYDPSKFPKGWFATDAHDTAVFDTYNDFDIGAEESVAARVPALEGEELEFWQADQAINRRGIHTDREGMLDCIAVIEQVHEVYVAEMVALTGGIKPTQLEQLKGWFAAHGVNLPKMDEEMIEEALGWEMPEHCHRVLELRALVGSASVKKVYAMRNTLARGDRIHDSFLYHAARTGRATGAGAQPTNMPNSGPDVHRCGVWEKRGGKREFVEGSGCQRYHRPALLTCPWCGKAGMPRSPSYAPDEWCFEAAEDARIVLATRSRQLVEHIMGDAMQVVSGTLRGLFNAAPGYDLVSADYSSIEAVVIAMLAGEQWRIEVFRTHGKIYEASASAMFNVPLQDILDAPKLTGAHHPLRKLGKVAELALAYKGWIGAARNFEMPGTDEEIKANILKWQAASPAIVEFWGGQSRGEWRDRYPELFGVEGMAIKALQNPGEWFPVMRRDDTPSGIAYIAVGRTLFCRLPSNRLLTYHFCSLTPSTREYDPPWALSLSYEGWNTNPKNGPTGWIRMDTYAGKLTENIVQAVARDILRRAIINLEKASYPVVIHVYDEIASEIPKGWGSTEEFSRIMGIMPEFAAGWPIRVGGAWRGERYRK